MRLIHNLYQLDCQLFRLINQYFNHSILNRFLHAVTHLGGSSFTIITTLSLIILTSHSVRLTATASLLALAISHLPVAIVKKVYPRQRPYIVLERINVLINPLKDHSFPSGHTTAIFSIIVPFIMLYPTLSLILLPIGMMVGLSRIFLGLHYPSDVITGMFLGSITGVATFLLMEKLFPYMF